MFCAVLHTCWLRAWEDGGDVRADAGPVVTAWTVGVSGGTRVLFPFPFFHPTSKPPQLVRVKLKQQNSFYSRLLPQRATGVNGCIYSKVCALQYGFLCDLCVYDQHGQKMNIPRRFACQYFQSTDQCFLTVCRLT